MKKTEMRAFVDARARELADSGQHQNSHSIEHAIRFADGVEDAHEAFARKWFRDYLDQLCHAAHQRIKHQRAKEQHAHDAEPNPTE